MCTENTNCSLCSDDNRRRIIDVLGKPVAVKNYICSPDGVNYKTKPKQMKLQFSVLPNSYCPASCKFCIAGDTKTVRRIDTEKFEKVMRMLKAQNIIRGIKITGGEPFWDFELLSEVIDIIFDVYDEGIELSISTNGIDLEKIHKIKKLWRIDTIHISRHHYDDKINRDIFGFDGVPDGERLREIIGSVSFKDIFVLNCMLLKDYINSPEEARRFLDFAIWLGAPKVGFMYCTNVNSYSKEQAISYKSVLKDDDPSMLYTRGFFDYNYCHCRDGVYVSNEGELIEFYGRESTSSVGDYSRGLVYDCDNHLKDGFNGQVIV